MSLEKGVTNQRYTVSTNVAYTYASVKIILLGEYIKDYSGRNPYQKIC